MSARGVGLDIGVEQVKAVALQKRGHQFILTGVGMSPIPPQADDEVTARAAKLALQEVGASKHDAVCVAIGGSSVVVKALQLPPTPLPRVLEAVRWSFRQHGLLPAAGAILDAQVLRTSPEGQMSILAVAVPQELVEHRLRVLAMAGVTPLRIDVEPLALLNTILATQEVAPDDTLLLLNLAPEASLTCVYQAAAGAPLIHYLQGSQQNPADTIAEIRTAVTYFQSELATQSTVRVVVCGQESAFTELKEEMSGLLSLWNHRDDPILFDPLSMLEQAKNLHLARGSIEGSPLTQAVGLAMRAL